MAEATSDPLWQAIQAFELDDSLASLTFTRRLARENGWSVGFAKRVVDEYKKFVYLAMTAGHEVTPSDEVDQAWHLHLTYTRSYWHDLCNRVLGRPLHHGPTKGGQAEGDRFHQQYADTLASYRKAFGHEAPREIWPDAVQRFGEAASFQRINRSRSWVIPKPHRIADRRSRSVAASFCLMLPPLAAGATWNPLDFDGPQFLLFYGTLAGFAAIASLICRAALRTPASAEAAEFPLDTPESIAALRGGWQGVFHTALSSLIAEEAITITHKRAVLTTKTTVTANRDPLPEDSELKSAILLAANMPSATLADLGKAARPLAERPGEALQKAGLLETIESFQSVRLAVGFLMGSVMLIGLTKLGVGLWREKPIGFLITALIFTFVTGLLLMIRPHRTAAGEKRWKRLTVDNNTLKQRSRNRNAALEPDEVGRAVALYGVAACPLLVLDDLRKAVQHTAADHGGCGGGEGSGDGGGDGGGGCGGCGGCGG